jgi:ubiquinone/menaquinone biosynthesis C-methylase UbiE
VALPLPDNSIDMVYTCLALEQMESIRPKALAEIARVAQRYVMFTEPFRDFNNSGICRDYIVNANYFQGWISDLRKGGLDPIFISADWPHKLNLRPGFVIAEKK